MDEDSKPNFPVKFHRNVYPSHRQKERLNPLWTALRRWMQKHRRMGVIVAPLMLLLSVWIAVSSPSIATPPDMTACSVMGQCNQVLVAQASTPAPTEEELSQSRTQTYVYRTLRNFYGGRGAFNIFIILFVTLGPLKIIPPFVKLTQHADDTLRKQLALRSFGLSTLVIFLVALIGQNLLNAWDINLPTLVIAAGIILFLVSLQIVMAQYTPSALGSGEGPAKPSMKLLVTPLTFPTILSPYGMAIALILTAIGSRLAGNVPLVLGLLLLVMLLNLVAMLAARPILHFLKPATLQVIGYVLGVMQLALGLELIIIGIQAEALIIKYLLRA